MSRPFPRPSWREQLPGRGPEKHFRWRGREASRLEGFADAVFAFAVTLLIVALEVPHTYAGLMDAIRGFPAFVACFALLMVFWNSHYRFFRRYGLQDDYTRLLNHAILLMVLFSVYPLKFLFSAWLTGMFGGTGHAAAIGTLGELQTIYRIYGLGLASIWTLYALLERHALGLRDALQLSPAEVILARATFRGFLLNIGVCALSILLSCVSDSQVAPGYVYILLGPLLTANGLWHRRRVRALAERSGAERG